MAVGNLQQVLLVFDGLFRFDKAVFGVCKVQTLGTPAVFNHQQRGHGCAKNAQLPSTAWCFACSGFLLPPFGLATSNSKTQNSKKPMTPRRYNPRMAKWCFLDYTLAASKCNSNFLRRNGGRRRDDQDHFPAKMYRNTKRHRGGITTTGTASPREAPDWIAAVEADRVGEQAIASSSSSVSVPLWNLTVRVCGSSSNAHEHDSPHQSLQQWLTSGKTGNLQVMCEAARGRSFRLPGLLTPRAVRSPVHVKHHDETKLGDIERLWLQKHQNVDGWYAGHYVDNVDAETGQFVAWDKAVMGNGLCQGQAFCSVVCATFLENVKKWFQTVEWWEQTCTASGYASDPWREKRLNEPQQYVDQCRDTHPERYVYNVEHWENQTADEDSESLTSKHGAPVLAENYIDTKVFDTATHVCERCDTSNIHEFYEATTNDFGVPRHENLCVACHFQVVSSAPHRKACARLWMNAKSVSSSPQLSTNNNQDDGVLRNKAFVWLDDPWVFVPAADSHHGPGKCQAWYAPECLGDVADGPTLKGLASSELPQLRRCCIVCVTALDLALRRQKAAVAEPELLIFLVQDVVPIILLFVSEPYRPLA